MIFFCDFDRNGMEENGNFNFIMDLDKFCKLHKQNLQNFKILMQLTY